MTDPFAERWNGVPYEGDINKALLEMYQGINGDIKAAVPGIDADMSRWGNLYQANKALKKGITNDLAGRGTGVDAPGSLRRTATAAAKRGGKIAIGAGAYGAIRDLTRP